MSEIKQNKRNFLFGLSAGVAIIAAIGFFVILGLYLKQHDRNDDYRAGAKQPSVVENNRDTSAKQVKNNKDIQLAPVTNKDWVKGGRNAKISIIEFSDTECPFCKRLHPTLQKLVDDYQGQVNWVYRYFPLTSLHPKSPKEAQAAECAGELGGNDVFWKYIDRIYEVTPSNNGLAASQLPKIAQEVGLDSAKFTACLDSNKYADKVKEQASQAVAAGGRGTPFSIIVRGNTKVPVSGAAPYEQFKSIIDQLLQTK